MNISSLISPNDFIKNYQEKKPLLLKGAVNKENFSWQDANEIFERSDVISDDFKISCQGIVQKSEYVEKFLDIGTIRHRLIKPVVYEYMKKGATIIANKIANEPKVNYFSRKISDLTGRQVVSSAYAAFGSKDSFRCHWDTRDVFAIQLIGRKRWIVYEPSFKDPLFTQQSKDYEKSYPCPEKPYMDFILEAGDVFYLPRGWWHNPLPLNEPTFHLALGTFPAYATDYLSWLMKRIPNFPDARKSLSHWGDDKSTLHSIGKHLDLLLNNEELYRNFQDEFTGAVRVASPLALNILGDPSVSAIPSESRLRLSAHHASGLDNHYLIANGTKINLDERGAQLISQIVEKPGISFSDLLTIFSEEDEEKIEHLIKNLCSQDILELSNS
ncbi:JmjC domain-containing protein [Cellvibrio polysaccharolyticus]|uniref:Cupin n=1 Tax=Cellvibrio polysaccharolyticus TaxID=2082724 RepID=A0A928V5Q0_9GAMM|nr:cupin domain-containing protein [Cellvibrio polysaccharolyticus]MBE8718762.1 cupin [Cellvibrio polysaccharolyticus]